MEAKFFNGSQSQWDEYVTNNHKGSIYNLFSWGAFLQDIYKLKPVFLAVYDNSNIIGVALLILMRNHRFKYIMVSLPFFCTGGILADNSQARKVLLRKIRELTNSYRCEYTQMRIDDIDNEFDYDFIDKRKSTFVLPLDVDHEKVFNGFGKQIRRRIRKGYNSGCEIDISKKYLDDFYSIYRSNMHFLGSPVHKKLFYSRIIEQFPENYTILVVKYEGKVIGAQVLSYFKDTVYLPLASSLRDYNKYSPNHLLYWESIKFGCENGYAFCDFGRSTIGSGPHVFKKQWNARETTLNYCYFYSKTHQHGNTNSNLKLISEGWKRLPLSVTNTVGPHLAKWLP